MDKIKAFEGIHDATYYSELLHEMAFDLFARYTRRNINKGILVDDGSVFYINQKEAGRLAHDAYFCKTVEEFNEIIERLEELEKPLNDELRKDIKEYMKAEAEKKDKEDAN